jgi:ATP-binding cassette, subfamily B, bacterial MsbA
MKDMEEHKLRALVCFVRPHLWAIPVLVVLGLIASAAEGFGIGMLIPLLDALVQREDQAAASNWFVSAIRRYGAGLNKEARLGVLVGTILALALLKSLILCGYAGVFTWFHTRIVHSLRCALFAQLLDVGYAFFLRTDRGRLLNTLEGETWRTSEALASLSMAVIHGCSVLGLGILLVLISWQMTATVAAGVALVTLLLRAAVRRARRLGCMSVSSHARLSGRMLEALSGMRVIRLFGMEAHERERFERASDQARRDMLGVNLVTGLIQPLTELLYVFVFVVVLLAWYGTTQLGTLLAFLLLLYRMQPHIKGFDHHRVEIASFLPAMAEVAALLEARDQRPIRSGSVAYRGLRESIVFRGVSFRYEEGAGSALSDLSCTFKCNQVTAIVGGSGAGKSTLVALLCRLYDPVEGEILVDGVPLSSLDLAAWRGRIALAGQDVDLMGDTILENIAYGQPDADYDAIVAAARLARADDFIMSLPDGLHTPVGERGLRLSVGQRQRIGLARALLRAPDILILDEATNALDSLSEQAFQGTLERLAGRLTMIVIAHRLSTTRLADRVIVLDKGRLVEQGRPSELLGADSMFARFWHLQVGAFGEKIGA